MKKIFNVSDKGQDGTDGSFICAVSTRGLAERVALDQGSMGIGFGNIEEIEVYENFEELPEKIKTKIIIAEEAHSYEGGLMDKLSSAFTPDQIELIKMMFKSDRY